ncbi:hypothetical protein P7K49_036974 [Saguinus oedipus]|uniref:Uncharacterized protein n=1 Tax=Saguinus oedipus TaxID=9490 RepID=A0ABQ9TLV1_SAGOE|nr:hypothetical protein P7K49_036974 [Saguinus oedipus]
MDSTLDREESHPCVSLPPAAPSTRRQAPPALAAVEQCWVPPCPAGPASIQAPRVAVAMALPGITANAPPGGLVPSQSFPWSGSSLGVTPSPGTGPEQRRRPQTCGTSNPPSSAQVSTASGAEVPQGLGPSETHASGWGLQEPTYRRQGRRRQGHKAQAQGWLPRTPQ